MYVNRINITHFMFPEKKKRLFEHDAPGSVNAFVFVPNIKKCPQVNMEMRSKLTKSHSPTEATENGLPAAPVLRLELG